MASLDSAPSTSDSSSPPNPESEASLIEDLAPETDTNPDSNSSIDAQLLAGVTLTTHKLEQRRRRIEAQIMLPYDCDQVWQVLTDYEGLANFIPNLATSQLLEHPDGGIRLEQIGVQNALFLKFSARVVLDMVEEYPQRLAFSMVEGDFNSFAGTWNLATVEDCPEPATQLSYALEIGPKRIMPIFAIEKRLCYDLPRNLVAIRQRLDELSAQEDA